MGMHFDEHKSPNVIIEDFLKEKAASTHMFHSIGLKKKKQTTPSKSIALLSIWFTIIYFISMILATIFVQQDYEDTFGANMDVIKEIVCSNVSDDIHECANSISALNLAQDERQMFSVAIYDTNRELIAMTKPSLLFVSDEGKNYYFPLEDYFNDSQIQELLNYARRTSEQYLVEVKSGIKSGKLLSLKLISEGIAQKNIVWKWENKHVTSNTQEESYQLLKRMTVRQMLAAPCYEKDKAYEKWIGNEFLQGFAPVLSKDAGDTNTSYESFSWKKSNVEHIAKVTYMNCLGEEKSCFVAIRSVGNTLTVSMKLFIPIYIIGFLLTLRVIFLVMGNVRKSRIKV